MRTRSFNRETEAFTLLEVFVVVAIILVLITLSIPTKDRTRRSTIVVCINNQRQIATGQFLWAADHNDASPWWVSVSKGGTMELAANGRASPHFQVLSNFNPNLNLFICPTDNARTQGGSFDTLSDSNISYFVNLGATTKHGHIILTGDRHLQVNGQPAQPGLLIPGSNASMGWTRELHSRSATPLGVLSFADGHTETVKEKLSACFQRQNQITNRLAIP